MKNKSTIILGAILTVLLCSGAYTTIGLKDSEWIKQRWIETNNHLGVIADELTLKNKIRQCELIWSQVGENTVIECVTQAKHKVYRR